MTGELVGRNLGKFPSKVERGESQDEGGLIRKSVCIMDCTYW